MTDMRYLCPRTLDEAVAAFAAAGNAAKILAGGTDLLVQMRSGAVRPGLIVDIKKIPEMTAVEETADGSFRIGAAVSGAVLAEHPRFGKVWPGLLEAINLIGSTQVQGRASAGGNLCNGSPAGDSVPAMFAAAALVTVQGPSGRREMPVEQVPAGPGRTNLKPGEIVVGFRLPPRPPGSGDAYLRMIPRSEMDIAVVGCGVSLTLTDGACSAARVGLGAVAPTVLLVEGAAKALIGSRLENAALEEAASACRAACRPIDDKRGTIVYRTKVAGVLLKRAAAIAAQRAGGK
jgi:carbon-monoxide dehydrogenase medium subunit